MTRHTPKMTFINTFIILITCTQIQGQLKLKGKPKEIEPIEKFTFLVEAGKLIVASTVRLEQIDILIGLDFEEIQWREILASLDNILETFPTIPFFQDPTLMEDYAGLCAIGQQKFNHFHQHMTECFKFKNEENIDTPVNLCSKEPLSIKVADLLRERQNIKTRYGAIDVTWSVDHVKTDVGAQNILFEFCSYFNDFSIVYERLGEEMLTSLEELSDGIYPEVLFGELIRDCNFSINGDGERYKVIDCSKTNRGYRCQVEITQSINLKNYTRHYAAHYDGITLMGYLISDIFASTPDVNELKFLDCDDTHSGDYPVCVEREVPEPCKTMLAISNIRGAIDHCNFTMEEPPVGLVIPHGGILVQGTGIEVAVGKTSVPQKPPIVIYAPDVLTIKVFEEDYVFPPAIQVEELIIVESKLSADDILYLHSTYSWDKMWEKFKIEDYIRYTLVLLQLIIFPIAISGCYFTLKQRNDLKKLKDKRPKKMRSDNYKNNKYFLGKIYPDT
jgi:hypothetical protein